MAVDAVQTVVGIATLCTDITETWLYTDMMCLKIAVLLLDIGHTVYSEKTMD